MNQEELKKKLEFYFDAESINHRWQANENRYELRMKGQEKPFYLSVSRMMQKLNQQSDIDVLIKESMRQLITMAETVKRKHEIILTEHESSIFPVMRNTSFPTVSKEGSPLVFEEHTAETRIYYALDLEHSYVLIDQLLLKAVNWSEQELKEKALFNLRRLDNSFKKDEVAGNSYYFISKTDGYAASRILNTGLLQSFQEQIEGQLCMAIPHQDVLVIADIRNEAGFDVLGQLAFQFYANGPIPITALCFMYENQQLEPVFIMANKKPKK
jgi:uncharacterized protein YtpQ (UPF0354 family)